MISQVPEAHQQLSPAVKPGKMHPLQSFQALEGRDPIFVPQFFFTSFVVSFCSTEPMLRLIFRVGAALAGVVAVAIPMLTLISFFMHPTLFARGHHYRPGFADSVWVYLTMLVQIGLCVVSAYLFLQYAVAGGFRTEVRWPFKAAVDRLFKSLAVGSAAVVILGIVSPFVLLGIGAIRFRNQPEGTGVDWAVRMWNHTADSPASWTVELAVFLLAFYWEYRRVGVSSGKSQLMQTQPS